MAGGAEARAGGDAEDSGSRDARRPGSPAGSPDHGPAQAALGRLFGLIGIVRVVCVDDQYVGIPGVEYIIGLCARLLGDRGERVFDGIAELRAVAFGEPGDVWGEQLRELWGGLDPAQRGALELELERKDESAPVQDASDAAILEDLMGGASIGPGDFRPMVPSVWMKERDTLLQDARRRATLFLFDIDLRRDNGTAEGGIGLLQDALARSRDTEDAVICGLLTHRVSTSDAYEGWKKIAAEHGLDRDRFVLISKETLRKEPMGFARMVRLTALNARAGRLKRAAASVLRSAQDRAIARVDEIDIFDFDRIVFDLSGKEGLWEPDTIFRLCGIFLRDEAREAAWRDPRLRELATEVRRVSRVDTASGGGGTAQGKSGTKQAKAGTGASPQPRATGEMPEPSAARTIQRLAWYESNVNLYHLPIELGDIFEHTVTKERYIVIAQPCDLAIRGEGTRGAALHEVTLAEIVEGKPQREQALGGYVLRYLAPGGHADVAKDHYVNFRKRHTVSLDVLDLCAYRRDGAARLLLGTLCPEEVIPSWAARYAHLDEAAKQAVATYRDLAGEAGTGLHADLAIPRSSSKGLFAGSITGADTRDGATLAYECARVDRLCQPYAGAMLTQFAQYFSRAAFDMDLDRER